MPICSPIVRECVFSTPARSYEEGGLVIRSMGTWTCESELCAPGILSSKKLR